MISWIVRILMIAAGVVTGWFVAKDAPIFGVAQMMVALLWTCFAFVESGLVAIRPASRTEPD